jgi:hypothetical protein
VRRPREFPLEVPTTSRSGVEGCVPTIYIFRSEYERRQARRLVENNVPFLYEHEQLSFMGEVRNASCTSCGSDSVVQLRSYTPDFYLINTGIFVETKGKFDAPNRTKMKQVCQQSEQDIRMVFMRDNFLTKKKKMSYGRWCDINNIQWAVGDIPLEWTR